MQSRFGRVVGPARMLSPEVDKVCERMARAGKLAGSMREAFVSSRRRSAAEAPMRQAATATTSAAKHLGASGAKSVRAAFGTIETSARQAADKAAARAARRHGLGRFTGEDAEAAARDHGGAREAAGGRASWAEDLERNAYDRAYAMHQERGARRLGLGVGDLIRRGAGGLGGAGEAAAAGEAAEGAAGSIAALGEGAAGAAVGVASLAVAIPAALAGAAVMAAKFVSPYSRAGQEISRTADLIGASADTLQRYRGAAELQGLSPHAADSALGNIGQALHNAKFGIGDPNQTRLLQLAGVDVQKDHEASALQKISAKLTSSDYDAFSQKKFADMLGVGELLPALKKGPEALSADMAAFDATGAAYSKDDLSKADKEGRSLTQFEQARRGLGRRAAMSAVGDGAIAGADTARAAMEGLGSSADHADGALEAVGKLANSLFGVTPAYADDSPSGRPPAGASPRVPASRAPPAPASSLQGLPGERRMASDVEATGGPPAQRFAAHAKEGALAARHERERFAFDFFVRKGLSEAQAAGKVANIQQESGFDPSRYGDSGHAYGLGQWHKPRRDLIERHFGRPIKGSSFEDQLEFMFWEEHGGSETGAGKRLSAARTPFEAGAIDSRYYERPARRSAEQGERGRSAAQVFHEMTGRDPGQVAHGSIDITVTIDGKGEPRITSKVEGQNINLVTKRAMSPSR